MSTCDHEHVRGVRHTVTEGPAAGATFVTYDCVSCGQPFERMAPLSEKQVKQTIVGCCREEAPSE